MTSPVYTLTTGEIDTIRRFASRVAATYQTQAKAASASLTVDKQDASGTERVWFNARAAEFGLCRFFALDPIKALDWEFECDRGWDLQVGDHFIDVKSSTADHPRLLWPVSKDACLEEANCDAFALCKIEMPFVFMLGFVSLKRFIDEAITSDGRDRLQKGTRYMHAERLMPALKFKEMVGGSPDLPYTFQQR